MIRIMSDTSSLYNIEDGLEEGIDIVPLSVTIDNKTYKDFIDISSEDFIEIINKGNMPMSSQPSVGEVIDLYNKYPNDEIINITMADGLSGTYNTAMMAREAEEKSHCIDVVNSKTLCFPHKYIVKRAAQLAKEGKNKDEILKVVNDLISSSRSYLIPKDYDYLVKGGRMSHLAGRIGSKIKLIPVLNLDEDGTKLHKFTVTRTNNKAISKICTDMIEHGVGKGFIVSIFHGCAEEDAKITAELIKKNMPDVEIVIGKLTPAFITQGGPGCVAIQCIKK